MLKPLSFPWSKTVSSPAAFRRLCVETGNNTGNTRVLSQPPSGGCVLKLLAADTWDSPLGPAAFRRLCVETSEIIPTPNKGQPAAFRRLCVETRYVRVYEKGRQPAAFRRLCVETLTVCRNEGLSVPAAFRRLCVETQIHADFDIEMLPAAFRRLCVETNRRHGICRQPNQPPSGGCVLKQEDYLYTNHYKFPAAFRRLCVETLSYVSF